MRTLTCERCGVRVFFENVVCENCGAQLGFVPDELVMGAFEIGQQGWVRVTDRPAMKPCDNYVSLQVCNWMLPAEADQQLCASCRTTHIVPALSKPENLGYWLAIEQAKRRLFYSLLSMQLPVADKATDPEAGVSFQFLEELSPGQKILTGHDSGVITLNIAEADDARREKARSRLHEPYRTLLGHFRHEIGHYYWDRLIATSSCLDAFRELFGDERADYAAALEAHYANPQVDWAQEFVSSYASSHPWEDWAECWAHYMHLQDGLETAAAWGVQLQNAMPGAPAVQPSALVLQAGSIEKSVVEDWLPVAQFVNAMSRSLGSHDSYPFVISAPVIRKLDFIHDLVAAARHA
ncbi:MAG: putative zinc-binding peptidase [Cytophagales bacterium]|nr:putative zinc-binding peptidase [Rhizobacter sp.]